MGHYALGPNEPDPPECPIQCIQPKCDELSIAKTELRCVAGRCVLDRSCDHAQALCDALAPDCPQGMIALVHGGCYGGCVRIEECRGVHDCSVCTAESADLHCTIERGKRDLHHCVRLPEACTNRANCECLTHNLCLPPLDRCTNAAGATVCASM